MSSPPLNERAFVSIRRSTILLISVASFAVGTVVSRVFLRASRRVQRYLESRGSNGGRRPVFVVFGDSITQGTYVRTH